MKSLDANTVDTHGEHFPNINGVLSHITRT
jgi:hypothetical protein